MRQDLSEIEQVIAQKEDYFASVEIPPASTPSHIRKILELSPSGGREGTESRVLKLQ
jgi:hypothetical protein